MRTRNYAQGGCQPVPVFNINGVVVSCAVPLGRLPPRRINAYAIISRDLIPNLVVLDGLNEVKGPHDMYPPTVAV